MHGVPCAIICRRPSNAGVSVDFAKDVKTVELLSPSVQFERQILRIEYRRDPLTGSRSRVNLGRAGRVRQAQRADFDLRQTLEETEAGCFFCPGNMEQQTPQFPPSVYRGGRIRRGQCTVFPNLFPFAEHHAVGTLTEKHYVELDGFTAKMLTDNLIASVEYLCLAHRSDRKARYPMWIWNHMPPSGASIIHPHVQIALDHAPTPEVGRLLEKSEHYFKRHGTNYWRDLAREEKERGERYIGETDALFVLATYAPRGNREVQFVFKEVGNLADLGEKQMEDFAIAIVRVLRCYREMGVNSFNLITYSAPVHESPEYYLLNARIISRPVFQPFYTNDTGFMERFFDVWVIETLPEELADVLRERFR